MMLAVAGLSARAQTVLANWTFENFTPPSGVQAAGYVLSGQAADVGTGTASAQHAAASTYAATSGNGSAKSLSINGWSVGDYYQFAVSTVGQAGITVSWDQQGSNTGPKNHKLQYSTDGTTFTDIATYVITNGGWNPTSPTTNKTSYTNILTSITAINNQAAVYFRLVMVDTVAINGTAVASGGTCRVDNFTVLAGGGGTTVTQYLNIARSGANVQLTWTNANYSLQSSINVTGTYSTVATTSPYTGTTNAGLNFYRLVTNAP